MIYKAPDFWSAKYLKEFLWTRHALGTQVKSKNGEMFVDIPKPSRPWLEMTELCDAFIAGRMSIKQQQEKEKP